MSFFSFRFDRGACSLVVFCCAPTFLPQNLSSRPLVFFLLFLQAALAAFYDGEGTAAAAAPPPVAAAAPDAGAAGAASASAPSAYRSTKSSKTSHSSGPRIHTFGSMANDTDQGKKKGPNEYYAGGGEGSGMAVEGKPDPRAVYDAAKA